MFKRSCHEFLSLFVWKHVESCFNIEFSEVLKIKNVEPFNVFQCFGHLMWFDQLSLDFRAETLLFTHREKNNFRLVSLFGWICIFSQYPAPFACKLDHLRTHCGVRILVTALRSKQKIPKSKKDCEKCMLSRHWIVVDINDFSLQYSLLSRFHAAAWWWDRLGSLLTPFLQR